MNVRPTARESLRTWMLIVCAAGVAAGAPRSARAQETSSDWAWKDVVVQDSVSIQYIFYAQPGEKKDGVVLKLVNRNPHPVDYSFTVIFRSGDEHASEQEVDGRIPARTLVTGEEEGLFFEPFEDEVSVGMIGIRSLRIRRAIE